MLFGNGANRVEDRGGPEVAGDQREPGDEPLILDDMGLAELISSGGLRDAQFRLPVEPLDTDTRVYDSLARLANTLATKQEELASAPGLLGRISRVLDGYYFKYSIADGELSVAAVARIARALDPSQQEDFWGSLLELERRRFIELERGRYDDNITAVILTDDGKDAARRFSAGQAVI